MELMTPEHNRWHEFIDLLLGPRGCNVRSQDDGWLEWETYEDFRLAAAILRSMGDFDVDGTFDYLNEVYVADGDSGILEQCAPERLKEWLQGPKTRDLPRGSKN